MSSPLENKYSLNFLVNRKEEGIVMGKYLTGCFVCNSNLVNKYWITEKKSGIVLLKVSPTDIVLY